MPVPDVRLDTSLFRFVPARPPRIRLPVGFRPPHPIPALFFRSVIVSNTRSVTTVSTEPSRPSGLPVGSGPRPLNPLASDEFLNTQRLHPVPSGQFVVEDRPRHEYRRENVGGQTDRQRDRESFHRAFPEQKQEG